MQHQKPLCWLVPELTKRKTHAKLLVDDRHSLVALGVEMKEESLVQRNHELRQTIDINGTPGIPFFNNSCVETPLVQNALCLSRVSTLCNLVARRHHSKHKWCHTMTKNSFTAEQVKLEKPLKKTLQQKNHQTNTFAAKTDSTLG